jgi:hypothetical protein
MRNVRITFAAAISCGFAASAWAQLQEIVVTGSRVGGEDYSGIPAVVLERRADFLVQRIELTNDTRSEDARTKELHQTIRDMAVDAAKRPGMALGYGEEFLIPITATSFEVPLQKGGKRSDTSSVQIYVKMALSEKDDVSSAIAALNAFIKKARVSGRTEIEPQGEVGLSLVNPEKYRYDIIAKISEDAKHLRASIASECKVEVSGLASRVSWQRSDVSELTLYIPYKVQLTGCQ